MKLPFAFLLLAICPALAFTHGGGLDTYGGHTNRSTGVYHCHRDGCESARALAEADSEGRSYSLIYNRDDWRHWIDADGNCINTRHEMLRAQAIGTVKLSPDGCYVSTGAWRCPFGGETFTRASHLDADHIIPLAWAHGRGGDKWSPSAKQAFANDPENLLIVHDRLNQSKGAKSPAEWMPPNHEFRCEYLGMWQRLLAKYSDLQMTPAEARVFAKQLGACEAH